MLSPSVVENLEKSSDWQELKNHMLEVVAALDSIDDINFIEGDPALIKGQAKKEAKAILIEILEPFLYSTQEKTSKVLDTKLRTGLV